MPKGSKSIFSSSCLLFLEFGRNHSCLLLLCIFGPFSSPLPPCSRVSSCHGKPPKASSFPSVRHRPTGQWAPYSDCTSRSFLTSPVNSISTLHGTGWGWPELSPSRHNELCPTAADGSERGYLKALGDPNYMYQCQTRLVSVDISAGFWVPIKLALFPALGAKPCPSLQCWAACSISPSTLNSLCSGRKENGSWRCSPSLHPFPAMNLLFPKILGWGRLCCPPGEGSGGRRKLLRVIFLLWNIVNL